MSPFLKSDRDTLPPLNALRHFQAVARRGSFAAAALDLNVTHWAIGKQIRLLEDWFGVPLFERRARGVVLTDEGAALLNDVSAVFERLATASTRLRRGERSNRVAGIVRLSVQPSFALGWLLPRMADFHARYPDIDVRMSTTSRRLRYIGDAFDLGIRSTQEHGADVVSRILMPDLRMPACSPAVLRQHPIKVVSDLRHHTLLHSTTTRTAWSQWLREAKATDLKPAYEREMDHTYLQLAAAIEGMGVAMASLPLIERDIAAGRLVCPFAGPIWHATDYSLVVNQNRASDEAVTAFEQWLSAKASEGNTRGSGR